VAKHSRFSRVAIPYPRTIRFIVNTPPAAEASVKAIRSLKGQELTIKALQEYHGRTETLFGTLTSLENAS
jgi:4-aminobutyrate aminotransferase-like enzyme